MSGQYKYADVGHPKTYEDKDGNTLFYEDEVIQKKRAELDSIRERISNNQELSLKNFESDSFSVNEITTDLDGLKKRLPENMAEKVFWLRKAEVSDVLETEESLFLFDCIETKDEESTKAARIRIIEQREQHVFEEAYNMWKKEVKVEINNEVWEKIAGD